MPVHFVKLVRTLASASIFTPAWAVNMTEPQILRGFLRIPRKAVEFRLERFMLASELGGLQGNLRPISRCSPGDQQGNGSDLELYGVVFNTKLHTRRTKIVNPKTKDFVNKCTLAFDWLLLFY